MQGRVVEEGGAGSEGTVAAGSKCRRAHRSAFRWRPTVTITPAFRESYIFPDTMRAPKAQRWTSDGPS
jgi:hypothetical protein